MTTITKLDEINLLLERYKGGDAKIWAFKLTLNRLFLRLSMSMQAEVVYIIAGSCLHINGPFYWENADLTVIVEEKKENSEIMSYVIDKSIGFKLVATGGVVLAKGTEKEFADYFAES